MTTKLLLHFVRSRITAVLLGALLALGGVWWRGSGPRTGKHVQVAPVASYEPVEVVPVSVEWPKGEPVVVKTVEPPNEKEARKLEKDFDFRLGDAAILGRFELPELPHGGKGVVTAPKGGNEDDPSPVKFTVKRNPPPPPPLFSVGWEPKLEGWYGQAVEPGWSGRSWSAYIAADELMCVKKEICLNGRAGREHRPWGEGWIAEVGVSWRF